MRVQITGFGIYFLLIITVMLMAAINYNNSIVYLLVFLIFGLFLMAFIKGWLNLFHLNLGAVSLNSVFANQTLSVKAQITNGFGFKSQFVDVSVETNNGVSNSISVQVNQPELFDFEVSLLSRGLCQLEKIILFSNYPLGLFRWSKVFVMTESEVWVYPEPVDHDLISFSEKSGEVTDQNDFDELVNWQQGDGLSGICWKTYARTGNRMKKQFTQHSEDEGDIFDWSQLEQLSEEQKLSQLCFWVKEKHSSGQPFGLKLPNIVFTPAVGGEHYQKCLEALAAFRSGTRLRGASGANSRI